MIIGVGGEKGGCGKTTLATNLAAFLAGLYEGDVGLLDADPKPAASNWAASRAGQKDIPKIICKRATGDIDAVIKDMGAQYAYTVIDCGGMDSREMRYAMAFGDVFLAPFMPSVYDLQTAKKLDDIVAQAKILNPNLKTYSVIAGASNNGQSKTTKYTRESLARMKMLTCMQACMHTLDVYRTTAAEGFGVTEVDSPKAFNDLKNIYMELIA